MTERGANQEQRENPLDTWNGIFQEISSISRAAGRPPILLDFSTDVRDHGGGKYFMRVRALSQLGPAEPDVVVAFLFLKAQEGRAGDGELVEISTARANWERGIPDTFLANTVPMDPRALCPLDGYEMVDAARQVLMDDSVNLPRHIPSLPPLPQTDLIQ